MSCTFIKILERIILMTDYLGGWKIMKLSQKTSSDSEGINPALIIFPFLEQTLA